MNYTNQERIDLLKDLLDRLNKGEALDAVRADFVREFQDVEASEIMKAEQQMIKEGMPVTEVQKLCDVHAALFHGNIRQERERMAEEYVKEVGHPLYTFTKENEALKKVIDEAREALSRHEVDRKLLGRVRELAIHYAKKGDLLYPHLKVRYGISGPSDVMWTVDDEIRDELAALSHKLQDGTETSVLQGEKELQRFEAVLTRAEEMIYKEEKILFPNCALNFTRDEWIQIYHDSKDYAPCFGVENAVWLEAETAVDKMKETVKKVEERADEMVSKKSVETQKSAAKEIQETNKKNEMQRNTNSKIFYGREATPGDQEIVMAGGHMTVAQLAAMLNTIPMEITFVDDQNINRFFNEGPKDFKRPKMAIDREVFSCHPPKIEAKVRMILNEFRAGTLDKVPVWMEKNGKTMLVTYMAVRDHDGNYIGTLELVQDMGFAKEHFEMIRK